MGETSMEVGGMPKETVNDAEGLTLACEVSWGRWATASISTRDVTLRPETPDDPRGGYRIALDRDGINHLIRALRKARDQAFGADA